MYTELPPPFGVPPVTLLVAAAAAAGVASAQDLLSEEPRYISLYLPISPYPPYPTPP